MPSDNNQEMFPVVNEQGNITGAATRGECHSGSRLLHPVVHLHIFNTKGELYLQKRPEWKDIQPGKWDTAVGGHIDLGESVEIINTGKIVSKELSKILENNSIKNKQCDDKKYEIYLTDLETNFINVASKLLCDEKIEELVKKVET